LTVGTFHTPETDVNVALLVTAIPDQLLDCWSADDEPERCIAAWLIELPPTPPTRVAVKAAAADVVARYVRSIATPDLTRSCKRAHEG
jgi:hypothetical protein